MNQNNVMDVGLGWRQYVRVLDAYANKHNITVDQVKEKFGGLRYYTTFPEGLDEQTKKTMEHLITAAEVLAFRTCEYCGQPGEQRKGGWIKVRCDTCQEDFLKGK